MSISTREQKDRVLEALREQRRAVVRVHGLVSESARVAAANAVSCEWHSAAAALFLDRVEEVRAELAVARRALANAIEAIDRSIATLSDLPVADDGLVGGVVIAR